MNSHRYLDSPQKSKTLTIALALAGIALAVAAYLLQGSSYIVAICMLVLSCLAGLALAAYVMHYIRHSNGGQRVPAPSLALHAFAIHCIFLLSLVIVGAPGTFSFGIAHALLDASLTALLLLAAGCFFKKGLNRWLAILVAAVVGVLSLLSFDLVVNILLLTAAAVLLVAAITGFKGHVGYALGALLLAVFTIAAALFALLRGNNINLHVPLHIAAHIAAMLGAVGALGFAAASASAAGFALADIAPATVADHTAAQRQPAVVAGDTVFNRDKWLDKAYRAQSPAALMDAPVDALYGVSEGDASLLKTAFGIKTIGDLANNKFFQWAEEITDLAKNDVTTPGGTAGSAAKASAAKSKASTAKKAVTAETAATGDTVFDRDKWLDKAYRTQSPAALMDAPVDALYGVSEGDASLLKTAFGIKTIGDLANNKFFQWAEEITDEAAK